MLFSLFKKVVPVAAILIGFTVTGAQADTVDDLVAGFYGKLLSDAGAADLAERVRSVVAEDWESIPTPRGGAGAQGLIDTLQFFHKGVPDLKFVPQEVLRDGDKFIVRSIATGTPPVKFFGQPTNGKSFEIMTIDIHQHADGKIVRSWHVEEWHKAIRQVVKK